MVKVGINIGNMILSVRHMSHHDNMRKHRKRDLSFRVGSTFKIISRNITLRISLKIYRYSEHRAIGSKSNLSFSQGARRSKSNQNNMYMAHFQHLVCGKRGIVRSEVECMVRLR